MHPFSNEIIHRVANNKNINCPRDVSAVILYPELAIDHSRRVKSHGTVNNHGRATASDTKRNLKCAGAITSKLLVGGRWRILPRIEGIGWEKTRSVEVVDLGIGMVRYWAHLK
jgi:hypothetical protein